jgi:hypothetical protein
MHCDSVAQGKDNSDPQVNCIGSFARSVLASNVIATDDPSLANFADSSTGAGSGD